jgi:hypothetical protein
MATKQKAKTTSKKVRPKAALTAKVLKRASKAATTAASKRAFSKVDQLLVVKDGWLVEVDKSGKVLKRVRRIPLPKVA